MNRRRFFQSAGTVALVPAFGAFAPPVAQTTPPGGVEKDIVFGKGGDIDLHLDIYRPPTGAPEKRMAVIHLHAGGFTAGSKTGVATSSRAFAGLGYVSIASQYRLAGQGQWPAQIHDAKAAVRWTRANASRLNIDPDRIAIAGYSAGGLIGNFVAATQEQKDYEGNGGNSPVSSRIAACASLYAVASAATARCKCLVQEGSDRATIEAASPVYRISSSFPPTIFFHGLGDTVIQPESTLILFEKLRAAGVKVDLHFFQGAPHGYEINDPDAALLSAQLADQFFDRLILHPREYGGSGGRGRSGGGRGQQ
jgi:acetyl esterase/lipase